MQLQRQEVKIISHSKKPSVTSPSELIYSETSTSIGTRPRIYELTCESSSAQTRVAGILKVNLLQKKSVVEYFATLMLRSQVNLFLTLSLDTNSQILQEVHL
jgi:hypothetical protein